MSCSPGNHKDLETTERLDNNNAVMDTEIETQCCHGNI